MSNDTNYKDKKEQTTKNGGNVKPPEPEINVDVIMADYKELVDKASKVGEYLAKTEVKSSQFRRIFNHIKQTQTKLNRVYKRKDKSDNPKITGDSLKELLLIKPKMAYTAGRHQNLKFLYNRIVEFIDRIETINDFAIFCDFIEATLAYHKYHGGKD